MRRTGLFLTSALLGFVLVCGVSARAQSAFASSSGLVTVQGSAMPLPLYLDALGRQSGRSVVVLPGVPVDMTAHQFVRVPWRIAWDSVVAAHGLVSCIGAEVVAVGVPGAALRAACDAVGAGLPAEPAAASGAGDTGLSGAPLAGFGSRVAVPSVSASAVGVAPGSSAIGPVAPRRYAVRLRLLELADNAASGGGVDWSKGLLGQLLGAAASLAAGAGFNPGTLTSTVSALEEKGLARKLDDVRLVLTEGRPTTFQSGGTLQLSLIGSGSAAIERNLQYGLSLSLTPAVQADGSVAVDVSADLASPASVSNPALLDLARRNVQSSVLAQPGSGVVLASFQSIREEAAASGVPGAAAVPAVGWLAGRASSSTARSTVVVTLELES